MGSLLRIAALTLAMACTLRGATFYVDPSAGNDASAGTATNTAWLHIPGATNVVTGAGWVTLQNGDTLWVKGGTTHTMTMLNTTWYNGSASFDSIQVRSGHLRSPQWGTTNAVIDGLNTFHSGFWIGNNTALRGVTVDGFEVRNIAGGGVGPGFDTTSGSACIDIGGSTAPGYITVRNCYLHDAIRTVEDTGHGIEVSGAAQDHFLFEKNVVGPNIGTKGIEVYRASMGIIRLNYVLAGTTHGVTGDHGIVISGNRWDVNGNLVSVHDGVHDPIYGIKVTGNQNDIWNNVVFGNTASPADIGGVYFVPANDASGQGSTNRFVYNTVYRLGSSGNFGEEGQSLVLGVVSGSGTTNNIIENNLLTFSTNAAGGFNMSYDGSTKLALVQFNDFFSGAGNTISMGRTSPSNFTVSTWQALTFDAGTTNVDNVQSNPGFLGGLLPTGLTAGFIPDSGFFALTVATPAGVKSTGNGLLGKAGQGYDASTNKFSADILGLTRTAWSMGAYELPSGNTAPSMVLATTKTASSGLVALAWNAPSSTGGATITNYALYRGYTSGDETLLTNLGVSLTYNDTDVTNGAIYCYQVAAQNSVGVGPRGDEVIAQPMAPAVPGAPGNLVSAAGNTVINLTWAAPLDNGGTNIINYQLKRGPTSGSETNYTLTGGLVYSDTGLANGVTVFYTVAAINSVGQGAASAETYATPIAPTTALGGKVRGSGKGRVK